MAKMRYFAGQNWVIIFLSFLFSAWALTFIYHSSYIASDGRLYFNLFDDAMISMRYAWNFAHGNGLVWNSAEYVEGYTNLLMTLLMAIASFFLEKRYAVLFIQLTGILFVLVTACCSVKIFEVLRSTGSSRVSAYLISCDRCDICDPQYPRCSNNFRWAESPLASTTSTAQSGKAPDRRYSG